MTTQIHNRDAIIEMARSVRTTGQDFMKAWEVLGQYYPGWHLDAHTIVEVTRMFLDQPMPEATKTLINSLRRIVTEKIDEV